MGIENPVHLVFIAAVALIVLGPRRLPELARRLGQGVREFREAMDMGAEHLETHQQQPAAGAQPDAPAQATPAEALPAEPPVESPAEAATPAAPTAEAAVQDAGAATTAQPSAAGEQTRQG